MTKPYTLAHCEITGTTSITELRRVWRSVGAIQQKSAINQTFRCSYQGYLSLGVGKIFHPGGPSNNSDVEYSWSPECLQTDAHGCATVVVVLSLLRSMTGSFGSHQRCSKQCLHYRKKNSLVATVLLTVETETCFETPAQCDRSVCCSRF